MTDRELMQQALDALDKLLDKLNADICDNSGIWDEYCDGGNAMQALRARLAQPEPEELARLEQAMIEAWKPIPQREWQGLKDDEIVENALQEVFSAAFGRGAKWAEAKLKEKNT